MEFRMNDKKKKNLSHYNHRKSMIYKKKKNNLKTEVHK